MGIVGPGFVGLQDRVLETARQQERSCVCCSAFMLTAECAVCASGWVRLGGVRLSCSSQQSFTFWGCFV